MSNRHVLILTNCTNRKRGVASDALHARSLPKGTYLTVSTEWAERVHKAPKLVRAGELYCGRAVTETRQAAARASAEVFFLSAGLGIVEQQEFVPTYNLTSSPGGPDSIEQRLTEPYLPALWWRALSVARNTKRAIARLIQNRGPVLTLVAVPSGYLRMVSDELEALPSTAKVRLRILGPRRAEEVPDSLRDQWMPYDDRLDDPASGFNGTTADFPHRALHHFTYRILDGHAAGSARTHGASVEHSLERLTSYVRPRGVTASDEQVLALISELWMKCRGNRNRVLRELRSGLGVACEQGRFRRLADRFVGKG